MFLGGAFQFLQTVTGLVFIVQVSAFDSHNTNATVRCRAIGFRKVKTMKQQLHSAVQEFLRMGKQPKKLFIGGEWMAAKSGGTIEAKDPGDGSVIAHLAAGDADDVALAVSAAQQAFKKSGWATMAVNDRAVILHRFADLVDKHREILAQIESLDVGKPYAQAVGGDIPNVSQTLRYYTDLAVHTRRAEPIAVSGYDARSIRVPYGVCAFVIPWNFPALLVGSLLMW
jgi:acyl-CoA reductase-like NAD-dependent aldehyde dehydrogenase